MGRQEVYEEKEAVEVWRRKDGVLKTCAQAHLVLWSNDNGWYAGTGRCRVGLQ